MAKPPAGSSLLFGAIADSGRIKQRKNGKFRMVLKGVDEIDWFTDRPDRVAGEWTPKKLVKKWENLFGGVEPNAQMSYTWKSFIDFAGPIEGRGNMSFEMFKPKLNKKGNKLSFNVKGIGKKNKEIVTGLADRDFDNISLFIDESIAQPGDEPSCYPNCKGENLVEANLSGGDLNQGQFQGSNLVLADLGGAGLYSANLAFAQLGGAHLTDVDLTNANLYVADLSRTKLNDANLTNANLPFANLPGANLRGANLTHANLSDADLSDADLTGAELSRANLIDADLGGANLTGAYLLQAHLTGANLDGAIWYKTICPDNTENSGNSPCTAEQLNLA